MTGDPITRLFVLVVFLVPALFVLSWIAAGVAILARHRRGQARAEAVVGAATGMGFDYSARDASIEALPFALFRKGGSPTGRAVGELARAAVTAPFRSGFDSGSFVVSAAALPIALIASTGRGGQVENVARGTWKGTPIATFDYSYYVEYLHDRRSLLPPVRIYHRFSCALVTTQADCPHLTIEPETLRTRLRDHAGARDIDFEWEEFNRAFEVRCRDRKFAYAFIDARMMRWLAFAGRRYRYETLGPHLLCYTRQRRAGKTWALLGAARELARRVPPVVQELYPAG